MQRECTQQIELIVDASVPGVDAVIGGFSAGKLTCVMGDSPLVGVLPLRLCVQTIRLFDDPVLYVDAGMGANPYLLAGYARRLEMDDRKVLSQVRVCRPFTVYQLVSALCDTLEEQVRGVRPRTLVVGELLVLFADADVREQEALVLLGEVLDSLRRVAKTHQLVVVVSARRKLRGERGQKLVELLYATADEVVWLRRCAAGKAVDVEAVKCDRSGVVPCDGRQLSLSRFGVEVG